MTKHALSSHRFGPDSPEALASEALGRALGVALRPRRLVLADGTSLEVEGLDDDSTVVAQFVLNEGAVRSALRNKIAADLFKLVWVASTVVPGARPVLCVSPTVASILARRGWLPAAARDLGVALYVVTAPDGVKALE